jgi:hypothetical protein
VIASALLIPIGRPLLTAGIDNVRRRASTRAAIEHIEDFRSGMYKWITQSGAPLNWTFDRNGLAQPGRLALYRPSMGMSDYTLEILGEVDRKALAWVFRAHDFDDYYIARLVVVKPGPLPVWALQRSAVLSGRETARKTTVLPLMAHGGTMIDITLDARGPDFTVRVQNKVVDVWSDERIRFGGVGFFAGKGEMSRIRWMRLTHQYDVIGRICALLSGPAPAASAMGSVD